MMKNLLFTAIFTIATLWLAAQTDILPPQLVTPADEAEKQFADALLDWYAVSGIGEITYTMQIDLDENFTDPGVFVTNFTSVRMQNLLFGNTYYWRVKAADSNGESDWSETFSFTVFDRMEFNRPNEGDTGQMPNVKLSWKSTVGGKPLSGLSYIQVQVDTANFWNGVHQNVTDDNLMDVFYTSVENGYVVGENGTILRYTMNGWLEQDSQSNEDLHGVSFISDTTGWVVGTGGTILYTMGLEWMEQDCPVNVDLTDVFMMADSTGYAVGEDGTIIYFDGTEWTEIDSPTTKDLFDIYYLDEMNIWVAGAGGTIVQFDGTEWIEHDTPVTRDLYSVSFIDAGHGWTCGKSGTILFYNGEEWVEQESSISDDLFCISMENTESGYAGSEEGVMVQFDGEEWIKMSSGTQVNLNGIYKLDDSNSWIVGDAGTILKRDVNGFSSPAAQIFSRPLDDSTSVRASQLYFGKKYYWRVRGIHDVDMTKWSSTGSFKTIGQVVTEAPLNNATDQMLNVFLKWKNVTGSFEYIYELCPDPDFSTPCVNYTDTIAVSPAGLMFGNTYYWRVKAAHFKDTTDWSNTWSFQTINTVYLSSPGNGDTIDDPLPKLMYNALTGISGYEVQYNETNDFSNVEIYESDKDFYRVQFQLEAGQTYYWRVRAFEDGDTTNWSDVWHFTLFSQGVDDLVLSEDNISIYPNPVKDELTIEVNVFEPRNVEICILNLLGEEIYKVEKPFNQGKNSELIDLRETNGGLYFVRLQSGDAIVTKKFIIRK
ncbi:MAG: T9SS type A sorting domain-containing protein [Bacteroidales bacterium]|nr:T9SS type A sorting domain-containing protein [Bacteroidales bacterium]